MNAFKKMLLVSAISLFALPASAATKIINLDEITYDLEIELSGEKEEISIEPGGVWETSAATVKVKRGDSWKTLERDAQYAIWKGGDLVLQSRVNTPSGRN